jgi:predicted DNA-binding transcriptional regulator AlpA
VKFLSYPELKSLKGIPYTRRHLRDLVAAGKFPRPVELSEARIAWIEDEIDQWQADKAAQRSLPGTRPDARPGIRGPHEHRGGRAAATRLSRAPHAQ